MGIQIDLPRAIEDKLREELGDLPTIAKESMLVELYRQDRLTRSELADWGNAILS